MFKLFVFLALVAFAFAAPKAVPQYIASSLYGGYAAAPVAYTGLGYGYGGLGYGYGNIAYY